MAWYYHVNGVNHGPIEVAELQGLRQQNQIAPDTLVWTEGMAQWEPFQGSRASSPVPVDVSMGTAASPAVVATQTCVECGKRFPQDEMLNYEGSWVCAACKPIFFQRIKEGVVPTGRLVFAGIGRRFLAVFLDGIIIDLVLLVPLYFTLGLAGFTQTGLSPGTHALVLFLQYAVPIAYETYFIGRFGATLGKMAMKVKVVRPDGSRVSYARALGRHFAKLLSMIILFIGYLMAFWDDQKRTLHDRICDTRVVDA